jgi:hypothetical protein
MKRKRKLFLTIALMLTFVFITACGGAGAQSGSEYGYTGRTPDEYAPLPETVPDVTMGGAAISPAWSAVPAVVYGNYNRASVRAIFGARGLNL